MIRQLFSRLTRTSTKLIVHGCYHKTGTHWLGGILRKIAKHQDWDFVAARDGDPPKQGIYFDDHSRFDSKELPPFCGSHMIRDPRDIVISGYFYHLWTKEKWAHQPRANYDGKTYQEHLQALDQEAGLCAEISRCRGEFKRMAQWDYQQPHIFEIRYEELIKPHEEAMIFEKLFRHYGFSHELVEKCVDIAMQVGEAGRRKRAEAKPAEGAVIRSGKAGQWTDYFTPQVTETFKTVAGEELIALGYEQNNNW